MKSHKLKSTALAASVATMIGLVGCGTTERVVEIPREFGVVESVCYIEKISPNGERYTVLSTVDERAELGTSDANQLMSLQRYINVGGLRFDDFDVSSDNSIVMNRLQKHAGGTLGYDLYQTSGGATTRLTTTNHDNRSPSFSNGEQHVYFTSTRGELRRYFTQPEFMWRASAMGSGGLTRLGSPAYLYTGKVTESPSGEYILYSTRERADAPSVVWYARTNGALPTQLAQGEQAVWVDDDTVMFVTTDLTTGLKSIWQMNLDGTQKTIILSDPSKNVIHPDISPDGSYVAYVSEDPSQVGRNSTAGNCLDQAQIAREQSRDISILELATGVQTRLTTNQSRDDIPKWSDDSQSLFFRSTRGKAWGIWRMTTGDIFQGTADDYMAAPTSAPRPRTQPATRSSQPAPSTDAADSPWDSDDFWEEGTFEEKKKKKTDPPA